MFNAPLRSSILALCLAASLLLAGCDKKVTAEVYDKITVGMTKTQVENLLGGEGADETASGTSISSAGIGSGNNKTEQTIVWKDGNAAITVVFKDGKVAQKSKAGL